MCVYSRLTPCCVCVLCVFSLCVFDVCALCVSVSSNQRGVRVCKQPINAVVCLCVEQSFNEVVAVLESLQKGNNPEKSARYSIYRVAKTHRMPYLYRLFSAKEPYNQWLF